MSTAAMRRYAAEIYRLQEDLEYVGISDLAEQVGASLQAISRMIGRLKQGGYVDHEPYRGVRLTPAGEIIAMPAIRRHRLVEVFLVRIMNFGWDEVHSLSDRFEMGIDDLIEKRIDQLLGHPTRCPHGEPIPTPEGQMPVSNDASLVEQPLGTECRLSRVRVHDPDKLHYLGELGLYPGVQFRLISIAPFNGPVRILVGRNEMVLSHELAAALYVEC
jgi:DtxR family Mn-dependent transcriptional regulator